MALRGPISEAEPGRRGLRIAIVAYRFASFAWMAVLVPVVGVDDPLATSIVLAAVAAWIITITIRGAWEVRAVLVADLGISAGLLLIVPVLMHEGDLASGRTFLAAAYPMSTVVAWAAAMGVRGGIATAAVLSIPLVFARPLNGVPMSEVTADQWISVLTGSMYYLMAGGAVGLLSETLDRAAEDLGRANAEALRQREQAARLHERERLARDLHDSVLQTLAVVARRARQLGSRPQVPGAAVTELANLVTEQERGLRGVLRRPDEQLDGSVPLRTVLERATHDIVAVPVEVAVAGEVSLVEAQAEDVCAAVHEALENVVRHARASRAIVFGEPAEDGVWISVRDDGVGFEFDEARIAREGRLGLIQSMRGRIEDLGGSMRLRTAPGRGTEVEFHVPASATERP